MIIMWKGKFRSVFTNYSLLNNYLRIIIELLSFIHYFIIIKRVTLFYIFLLKNIFEFKFQILFHQILGSKEFPTNFRIFRTI
jgi:hypothetical protein